MKFSDLDDNIRRTYFNQSLKREINELYLIKFEEGNIIATNHNINVFFMEKDNLKIRNIDKDDILYEETMIELHILQIFLSLAGVEAYDYDTFQWGIYLDLRFLYNASTEIILNGSKLPDLLYSYTIGETYIFDLDELYDINIPGMLVMETYKGSPRYDDILSAKMSIKRNKYVSIYDYIK